MNDRGPNDLEATIERLKFRNEKLHNKNEKQTKEILELREDNKKLAKHVDDLLSRLDKLRHLGVI